MYGGCNHRREGNHRFQPRSSIFIRILGNCRAMVAKTDASSARLIRSSPTHCIYEVRVAGHTTVTTTVTAHPGVTRRWVYKTLWIKAHRLRWGGGLTVGMGVQWTPPFRRLGAEPRPGTLQLCCMRRCLVFQIAQAGGDVPSILRRFLDDARVAFVAYNIGSDCRKLRDYHGLEVACPQELRAVTGMGNASMEWDGRRLSKNQVIYASIDACISHCIGVRLGVKPDTDEYTDSDYGSDAWKPDSSMQRVEVISPGRKSNLQCSPVVAVIVPLMFVVILLTCPVASIAV
jgi:hypothetical protein